MHLFFRKFIKTGAILITLVFVSLLFSGAIQQYSNLDDNKCFFTSSENCIGPSGHLVQWQSTSIVSLEQSILNILTILIFNLSLVMVVIVPVNKKYTIIEQYIRNIYIRIKRSTNIKLIIYNYFIEVFSRGILHPKLF